jgi:hypothetical protein
MLELGLVRIINFSRLILTKFWYQLFDKTIVKILYDLMSDRAIFN